MSKGIVRMLKVLVTGQFWLTLIKVFLVAFVLFMVVIQIPELAYDTLGNRPVVIDSPSDLDPRLLEGSSYAKISGTANFEYAFVYERYGLSYTYFTLDPYGIQIIARAYGADTTEWESMTLFEGKLRPFESQPFSYVISGIFAEQTGSAPASDAYYLGVGDIPAANGWQIGSIIFAVLMLAAMIYFFFFFHREGQKRLFSDPLDYLNKGIAGESTLKKDDSTDNSEKTESEPVGQETNSK